MARFIKWINRIVYKFNDLTHLVKRIKFKFTHIELESQADRPELNNTNTFCQLYPYLQV